MLVTTVGVAPGLAALRLAGGLAVRGLPGYIGQGGGIVMDAKDIVHVQLYYTFIRNKVS